MCFHYDHHAITANGPIQSIKAHLLTVHVRPEPRVEHGSLAVSSVTHQSVDAEDGKIIVPISH